MTLLTGDEFDVFLSHASEDKRAVVEPLAAELKSRGLAVWFDQQQLTLGDSLSEKIDEGLSRARFGVVVLSHAFFAKRWPMRELDGLVARETAFGVKVILPVWHELTVEDITGYSPTLAGKLAADTSRGLPLVADQIVEALRGPVTPGQLVRTNDEATLRPSPPRSPEPAGGGSAEGLSGHVRAAVLEQRLPELRAAITDYIGSADSAFITHDADGFADAMDCLATLSGTLALLAPDDPVTRLALGAFHRVFDAGQRRSGGAWQQTEAVTSFWPKLLENVRALGALLTRLELWSAVRLLAAHQPPSDTGPIYPGWLCFMEVQLARRRGAPSNGETHRQPLRRAAELAASLPGLSPDRPSENAALDSVLAFDLLSRLVETDLAERSGRSTEMYPGFVFFSADPLRPLTRRLVEDDAMAAAVLPSRAQDDRLRLMAVLDAHAAKAAGALTFWEGILDPGIAGPNT
ncbi:MAG: toll/interleukin-1 receptor domain-containing protein [Solirubrobacteraceae bacterium]